MTAIGPSNTTLTVKTTRAGMAAKAGHDLVLEVERWTGVADFSEPAAARLEATIEADSLVVRDGTGGLKPLTDADRSEIHKNIVEKVLQTAKHPQITFRSTAVSRATPALWRVTGELTIAGNTVRIGFPVTVTGSSLEATVRIEQSAFGIKPFSAMMGALKVADGVEIHAEARTA